jgi:hypothetical protein
MNAQLRYKLEKLRADYQQVKGHPFTHFFCPILFRDEDTFLCKGHIISKAFPNSSRRWTVQRKDVDSFFGSSFEADFSALQYKEIPSIAKTLTDKDLFKRYSPRILIDNKPVDFFIVTGEIPTEFTRIIFEDEDGQTVFLGIKMSPEEFSSIKEPKPEIVINMDLRVSAVVSLIKAAHLTLFDMTGYHYALSAGGIFVGWEILGKFYLQNHNCSKTEIFKNAIPYFREYAHMVRPLPTYNPNIKGTATDGLLFLCKESTGSPWAMVVFIKTSLSLHAVMIPILDDADKAKKFFGFLQDDNETLVGSYCKFFKDHWEIIKESNRLIWPKRGVLYPEFPS